MRLKQKIRLMASVLQALAERQAMHAPVTSLYVQQLLTPETSAPESAVQKELLDLKDQITQAAAVLELEKQAFQRSRVSSSFAPCSMIPPHAEILRKRPDSVERAFEDTA